MPKVTLSRDENVFVLHMCEGENRFNFEFLAEFNQALDEAGAADGPKALVTVGEGKFYSNGLDLEMIQGKTPEEVNDFLGQVHAMFARVLSFPGYTVAAMNGHTFAGGGMLALAHDVRVMRSDRGFFCLPEVDLGMPFTRGMAALIKEKLPLRTVLASVLTGDRFSAEQCLAAGIVDAVATEEMVLADAVKRAAVVAPKGGATQGLIKEGFFEQTLKILRGPEGVYLPH
jgi:enoyl-CoA hydratase/carnithine racemase